MQNLTMVSIGALAIGIVLILQDYGAIQPYGQFTFSPLFYIGNILVIGSIIGFVAHIIKEKTTKPLT
jgi:hypothetical protein